MNIAHISDVHIKNNAIDFSLVYEKLHELQPNIIVLTGDIVDSTISFNADIIHEVNTFLVSLSAIAPVIMIPGNHDQCIDENSDLYITITKNHEILKPPKFNYWNHSGRYEFMNILWNVIVPYEDIIDYEFSLTPQILLFHEDLTRINVETFSMYTAVMAGHIHTRQFITNNAAYAGSLFQQNIKESHNNHGFLFWKISKNVIEVDEINIPNNNGFLKVEIKDNIDITEYPIPDKVIYYDVYYTNSNQLSIISKYEEKYNSKPRYIKDKTKEIDINDIDIHIDLISKYLGTDHEHLDKIISMHKKYYNQFYNYNDSNNNKVNILSIEFENMYAYETKNVVDFTKMNGKLSGLIANNSLGKSSFLDIILYALYDVHPRIMNKQCIMNKNTKKYYVKLIFDINGILGEIYKTNNNCIFHYDNKNLTQKTISQTLNIIKSIIGSYNHATITSFQLQYDFNNFVNMSANTRKQKLVDILSLNVFEKIENKIVKLISEYTEKYKLINNLFQQSGNNNEAEHNTNILKYKILCINKLSGVIITNNISNIECPIEVYDQAVQLHEKILKLTEQRKILIMKIEDNKHLLQQSNNVENQNYIEELNEKIISFEPASIRESVMERYLKYDKKYLYRLCRVDKNNDIISQSINLASLILERDNYKMIIESKDKIDEIKKISEYVNQISNTLKNLITEMNMLVAQLPPITSLYDQLFYEYNKQIKNVKKNELTDISKELTLLKIYRQVIKPTNGITSILLNDIKESIEVNVNNLLKDVNLMVKINNNYDVLIHPHMLDISLSSGYQNFILNIAFKIALCNISNVTVPNILIIDEGLNRCDEENTKYITTFLKSIKNPNILIISHINKLFDYIEYPLTINNGSITTENTHIEIEVPHNSTSSDEEINTSVELIERFQPVKTIESQYYCATCNMYMKMSNKQKHLTSTKHKKNT